MRASSRGSRARTDLASFRIGGPATAWSPSSTRTSPAGAACSLWSAARRRFRLGGGRRRGASLLGLSICGEAVRRTHENGKGRPHMAKYAFLFIDDGVDYQGAPTPEQQKVYADIFKWFET